MSLSPDKLALPVFTGDIKLHDKLTGDENTPQQSSLLKQNVTDALPQSTTAGSDAAKRPSRTPMLQLPQNPPPSLTGGPPLLSVPGPAGLAGTSGSAAGARLGGSTTYRDNRQTSPARWLSASSSGAFTARGQYLSCTPCTLFIQTSAFANVRSQRA